MQSAKEAASNVAASAQSGMEKSKALAQEKMEKITSRDPMQKEMATQKKEQRISEAERQKQAARMHNAAVKETASVGGGGGHVEGYTTGNPTTASYSTTGARGTPGGPHQMSALPGHGTGQPMGQVVEGTTQTHPIGTNTGMGMGGTAAKNTHVGGGTGSTYGTGGGYT